MVVLVPEVADYRDEVVVFLLHFLVVAAALLGLPGANEGLHGFEYFVHAAHVPIHKMFVVNLKEPVISFVLLLHPVPPVYIFLFIQGVASPPLSLCRLRRFFLLFLLGFIFRIVSKLPQSHGF